MGGFIEQLMLAEKAAENIYFAKVNRDLTESLRKRMRADIEFLSTCPSGTETQAASHPVVVKEASGG
jgi:16S rRNA U516 pseudouridylate synthase RsuA-like enzyme